MTGEVTEVEEPNGSTGAEVPEGSAGEDVKGSAGANVKGSSGAEITGNSAGLSESIEEV